MEQDYKLIGAPCAVRGPYTFYKAFKYTKNSVTNILTINEFFFVKLWNDSDFISIGELRLLWEDQSCDKALASLRLYILPENTPDGRVGDIHGEDEVLAITEKVIIRLEDLLTWITDASDWHWGLSSVWTKQTNNTSSSAVKSEELNVAYDDAISTTPALQTEPSKINGSIAEIESHRDDYTALNKSNTLEDCSAIDYSDVLKEKAHLDFKNWDCRTGVLVLSYSRYCRYRALLRRLEGVHNDWLRDDLITALGGFATVYRTTKILFCRDTFDYPELEGHELLCNHLAPKLRSRIPKKKKTLYPSPDVSDTDSSEYGTEDDERSSSASSCSSSTNSNNSLAARFASNIEQQTGIKRPDSKKLSNNQVAVAQQAFTQNLYAFMKARLTPIGRLPLIGNKEINLYEFYNKVKLLGSYASVTNNKLWKYVFEELGGDRGDPSMATLMRKYYEKFLLPYEQHMVQQLKHSSVNQSTSSGSGGVIKSQCLPPSLNADYRYQADRRKVVTTIRPVPGSVRLMDSKSGASVAVSLTQHQLMKPPSLQSTTGGKENIPVMRKLSSGTNNSASAEVVIDLCAEEESSTRATSPRKCSSTEPEVIDLCEESPIKRSVPSIAATLIPRKRKLDILREGGLEVTPVGTSGGSGGATVRRLPPASVAISAIKSGETSLEVVDAASQKAKLSRASNQVLDLRTMRNSSDDEDSVVKKFSPSLGPNIEISLVANDTPVASNGGGNASCRKDDKKRKPVSLPVPALRKISTGELSLKNLANSDDTFKSKVIAGRKMSSDVTLTKAPSKPSATIATTGAHMKDKQATSLIQHVNPSVYLAAFYNSIFPESGADTFIAARESANSNNPYQIQLNQQQMNYVKDAFMQQSGAELDVEAATDAFAQKFTNMLKNGTVSIVENYEKILPD